MIETAQGMIPVSEWDENVGVSLSLAARRWGLSEAETLEMFAIVPMLDADGCDYRVAETGERLWAANIILTTEDDLPDLTTGRAHETLEALRSLKIAVESVMPGMFSELLHRTGCVDESLSADELATLAAMEPEALHTEFARLDEISRKRLEQLDLRARELVAS